MSGIFFVLGLGIACALLLGWGFKALPQERWQMLAALPTAPDKDGHWHAVNLTYYGVFTASSLLFASIMALVLLRSIGVSIGAILGLMGILFAFTLPAAKLIAAYVEGKTYGFTVGGACFVGVIILPWAVALVNFFVKDGQVLPVIPVLAAVATGYSFGEGIGRLACISFGCCYGKALDDCSPWVRKIFAHRHFVFTGKNKKIAYISGLDCQKVVPIQGVTAVIYVLSGLVSTGFFLAGYFRVALGFALIVTQIWRAVSEIFRSDYRGEQKISAYQIMSLIAVVYAVGVIWLAPTANASRVVIMRGLQALWNPGIVLVLQALWVAVFLYTGRSMVTGSTISFHVHRERV